MAPKQPASAQGNVPRSLPSAFQNGMFRRQSNQTPFAGAVLHKYKSPIVT
jgi:hypothetical protein